MTRLVDAHALPATRDRLVAGTLGVDHARIMTEVAPTSQTRTDALAWLIDTRTGDTTTPEQFVQTITVDFPDPADDPHGTTTREQITKTLEDAVTDTQDDKAPHGEFLDLSQTLGGYHVAGFLTDEHGLLVHSAITALLGAPAAEDTRTTTQRRAQGLADLARVVLDANRASPRAAIPPHLNVTVSWSELTTQATRTREGLRLTCGQTPPGRSPGTRTTGGTSTTGTSTTTSTTSTTGTDTAGTVPAALSGLLTGGGPVFTETGDRAPRALLRRLACDSAITRIVFGPDGAVIDVGRTQRTVTGQMRRAVIARDQHCVYPGCDQPPSRCEVHHAIRHWAHGGETSITNSALLCWHHHQLVDAQGITMHWTGKPANDTPTPATTTAAGALIETGWAFTDPHGHRIQLPEPTKTPPTDAPPTKDPPDTEAA